MTRDDALRVLAVNASVVGGGAERIALSLHEEYLARGLNSWLAVGNRNADAPNVFEIPNDAARSDWARSLLARARGIATNSARPHDMAWYASRGLRVAAEPIRYARVLRGFEDFDFPQTRRLLELAPVAPDVLHLHNLHGSYFDIRALPQLSAEVPTVLTIHDTWLLTGHCANPLTCEHWRRGCGECPFLDVYVPIPRDESAANRRLKREALLASRLALAVPSSWMMGLVESSGLLGGSLSARVIPNGVDTRVFRPGDRAAARAALDLPSDALIITFAARSVTDNPFKDFETLERALASVARTSVGREVLLVALGGESAVQSISGIRARVVPFIDDPSTVARYFQASDLYVHPTRAESFGLVVAEAMACGAAVIATRVGGVPDIVVDGETGLLVGLGDADAMAEAIGHLLTDADKRAAFGSASARRVSSRFTLQGEADSYLAWYEELIEARRRVGGHG